ncbi:dockerin type I domain-containing protein [Rosistilla carotiformis]|uniref:dockerin type I domain-containing protein n=1 Tax=Rosistilla carotiformis TaxID=2528017 RepID=UPI0011A8899B|nr:dockerin type I domain-containing protein [Rosistilla carotiformis]
MESRQLLAGLPLGASSFDTAEYLLGRVAVTPVFIESDGSIDPSSQDWSTEEIAETLAKVTEGMQWWADTLDELNTVHSLEFVIDDSFATTPYESPYEPIARRSDDYVLWVSQFLHDVGHADSGSLDQGIREFNDAQRQKLDTDWSFTIFVAAADANGQFASGGSFSTAFALPGGLFFVSPSSRPTSTFSHEAGHIFYALDEYQGGASAQRSRGYYNTLNSNAIDGNPQAGFVQQPSIMSGGTVLQTAFLNHTSAASTLALVGWQDSDGDGIFDVLDVPLKLSGSGRFDSNTSTYRFQGTATAQALPNQNPSGLQNDITLNEISWIEYQIDGGDWIVAAQPNLQTAALDLQIPISAAFNEIRIRAVDRQTGVTSNLFTGTADLPATTESVAAISGHVWLDRKNDQTFDSADPGVAGLSIQLIDELGQPISLVEGVDPDNFPTGGVPETPGVTISAIGTAVNSDVFAVESEFATTGTDVFAALAIQQFRGSESWSSARDQIFQATFDDPVRQVWIDATALTAPAYGRIEAYDSNGDLIYRVTSDAIATGESVTLEIATETAQIASVQVFGHAETSIALDNLRFGTPTATQTDRLGTFSFVGLPDGQYRIQIDTERPEIFQIQDPLIDVDVTNGAIQSKVAVRVLQLTSPWQNPADRFDVNDSNSLEPLDALQILNEINRNGSRALTSDDIGARYFDVNGDGLIAPIDVLNVINAIQRTPSASSEGESVAMSDQSPEDRFTEVVRDASASVPLQAFSQVAGEQTDKESLVAPSDHEQATDAFFATQRLALFQPIPGLITQHATPTNQTASPNPEEKDDANETEVSISSLQWNVLPSGPSAEPF